MSGADGLPPFGDRGERRARRERQIDERDLAALAAAIEDAAIEQRDFSHARHLLLALHYVRAHGPEGALARMRSALQAFNARHPPTNGYHETITVAWLTLVARHAADHGGAAVHELAEGLLDRHRSSKALFAHYSRARLLSDDARAAFVAPDLAPLPAPGDGVRIRLATEADLAAIEEIYAFYVERSTCTFATTVPTPAERRAWLAAHGPLHPATVAVEGDGTVVGWGSLSQWNPREAYARSVENSVYVRDGLHRRGLGRRILADLVSRAISLGHRTIIAQIAGDQAASVALHRALGFEDAGVLRDVGYKFDRWLDVILMQRAIPYQASDDQQP
ncbi:putative acetyltransferase [Sorangium cellulosum So ce56]|uniref:Acetyltransferase n=1 Tax=Sorangium cellulosum (strain So ce56) TaxID=448385 RepID=A9G3R6_SORC5|nr:GNAT family N-acetyltransferase [Sorangium cellulosum]CAN95790.1 putative acetyltransferase [Sorangium cellulosum So ce56]